MSDPITSTIAQLLFRSVPPLDFPNLVDDLRTSLMEGPTGACGLNWDHEDVAIFNLDNARIILGWSQPLPGRYAACLTIGVGADESGDCQIGIASHQGTITRLLADRINARYMSDRMLWKTSTQSPTAEMIDVMVEELPGFDPAWPGGNPDSCEFDRMLARYDAETAEQISELAPEVPLRQPRPRRPQPPAYRTERPKPQTRTDTATPANDIPAKAHPSTREMQRIRAALAETEQEAQAARAPRRLFGLPLWRARKGGSALVAASLAATLGSQLLQPALAAAGY
ncbi:hypothetical protein [Limimaricola litoreus]|uniref:Uncharacterized protein n=1 Tax=Limimaricola litoreus TaxID=2955316 RepID=A0A9X2FUD3_9RHOB|nr:hypothetical protein [Limimaricola litoreus]MCP1170304.1 hypothetical protein [Limimaricola litoreus]